MQVQTPFVDVAVKNRTGTIVQKKSIIDYILYDDDDDIRETKLKLLNTLLQSDHYALYFQITFNIDKNPFDYLNSYYFATYSIVKKYKNDKTKMEEIANEIKKVFYENNILKNCKEIIKNENMDTISAVNFIYNTFDFTVNQILIENDSISVKYISVDDYIKHKSGHINSKINKIVDEIYVKIEKNELTKEIYDNAIIEIKNEIKSDTQIRIDHWKDNQHPNHMKNLSNLIKILDPQRSKPIEDSDGNIHYDIVDCIDVTENYVSNLFGRSKNIPINEQKIYEEQIQLIIDECNEKVENYDFDNSEHVLNGINDNFGSKNQILHNQKSKKFIFGTSLKKKNENDDFVLKLGDSVVEDISKKDFDYVGFTLAAYMNGKINWSVMIDKRINYTSKIINKLFFENVREYIRTLNDWNLIYPLYIRMYFNVWFPNFQSEQNKS